MRGKEGRRPGNELISRDRDSIYASPPSRDTRRFGHAPNFHLLPKRYSRARLAIVEPKKAAILFFQLHIQTPGQDVNISQRIAIKDCNRKFINTNNKNKVLHESSEVMIAM